QNVPVHFEPPQKHPPPPPPPHSARVISKSNYCFDQTARLNASRVASLARSNAARVSVKADISADHDSVPAWLNFSSFFSASTASALIRFTAASISSRRSEANSLASLPSLSAASRQAFNWASA